VNFNDTTCGMDSYKRGIGQKIVGFSFYGDIHSTKFQIIFEVVLIIFIDFLAEIILFIKNMFS
jgi:hypothetical protein